MEKINIYENVKELYLLHQISDALEKWRQFYFIWFYEHFDSSAGYAKMILISTLYIQSNTFRNNVFRTNFSWDKNVQMHIEICRKFLFPAKNFVILLFSMMDITLIKERKKVLLRKNLQRIQNDISKERLRFFCQFLACCFNFSLPCATPLQRNICRTYLLLWQRSATERVDLLNPYAIWRILLATGRG